MTPTRSRFDSRWDLAPLAHPLWWAALALLIINDNLFKGHGVVPGWLTGKLSDFAFLVVAPVVFAALLPRALPGRRPFAIAAVVGVYVAAELSPAVSDAVVTLAARLRLRWRLWPDPTDLVALAVLPLTIHLLNRRHPVVVQRAQWMRERAGVVLGAAACLATSAPPSYSHSPFLFNATGGNATVRVTWLLRSTGNQQCDDAAMVAASLNTNDLDDAREIGLASGQVAVLDGPPKPGNSPVGVCAGASESYTCMAAILEAPPAAPVLVVAPGSWREYSEGGFIDCGSSPPAPVSLCQPMLDPTRDAGPDAVTLKEVGGQRQFVAGALVQLVPIDLAAVAARTPAPDGCRSLREQYRSLTTTPSACTTNADCVGRGSMTLPSESPTCGIHVNRAAATALDDIERNWASSCIRASGCADVIQPAVCRNGSCAPACPGVEVPFCPGPCDVPGLRDEFGCYYGGKCVADGGQHCTCVDGGQSCDDPQPAAPGCSLSCVDYPGGGTLVDGGAID